MKFATLLFATCLMLTSAAFADLVIVQHMEGPQSGDVTMKIKGDNLRIDTPQASVIREGSTGDMINVMPQMKSYMRMPAAQLQAMTEQVQKMQPAPAERPKLVATGKVETINGYKAEEFTTQIMGRKMVYWLAKDYPNFREILKAMEKLQSTSTQQMKNYSPAPEEFTGMPVKTVVDIGNGQKLTTTLVSVKEENLSDQDFAVPAGYNEMKMPAMPNAPAGR